MLTETFIERELAEISRRGKIDLQILSLAKGSGEVSSELNGKVFYKRLGPVALLNSLPYFYTRGKYVSKALSMLSDCGLSPLAKFYILIKGMGYARVFYTFKPDLVIAHFMSDSSTVAVVAATILGVPFAISAHAKDVTVKPHCIKGKIERAAFVLVCNKRAFEYCVYSAHHNYSHKIMLKYHGLNHSDFERTRGNGEVPLILNIARLEEKKGHRYLIEAAKIMKDAGVKFKMAVIGPGSLYAELEKMISEKGLSEEVEIVGEGKGLPFSETRDYYSRADVFVFPGINTQEGDADGIANVLLEAAASHIPIVATDSGSTTEFLENEKSAVIVPQKDPSALAGALMKLLNDRAFANQLAEEAYKKVAADFDINMTAAAIEDLILKEIL